MKRSRVQELHYIVPHSNIPSILEHGLLSHRRAERLRHHSVANPSVQAQRSRVRLPTGRNLLEYVNLYFDARNPMMYVIQDAHLTLAVLRIDPSVLDLPGAMISDGNAARGLTRFAPPTDDGFAIIDETAVFAEYWTHADPQIQDERKRIRCAEVLVPDRIPPEYILGAYVSCQTACDALAESECEILVHISEHLFFRRKGLE